MKRVTKEIATRAKEAGFDVQTYADCWVKTLDGEIMHNSERKDTAEHDRSTQVLMQPTYTQLKNWLWENKQIFIVVKPVDESKKINGGKPEWFRKSFSTIIYRYKDNKLVDHMNYPYFGEEDIMTPQEALETGIDGALTMLQC